MPPITLSSISNANVKVRWKEPYASEGLNRKLAVVVPSGVYRGLKLGVSTSNLSVDLVPDATAGDHVAVHENQFGFSTTYVDDTSGTITLPLTGFLTNDVVVVCLYVAYTSGATTTALFRGYELSEYEALSAAVKQDLVVLGTVLRPASGIIPVGNITHDRRRIPFLQRTDEATPWNPLIRNGGFELGQTGGTYRHASPFWKTSTTNANFTIRPVAGVGVFRTGAKSLEMTAAVAGIVVATIQQDLWMPVTPGRYLMGRLYKRVILAPSAAPPPTGRMRFLFGDLDGINDVQEDLLFDISATDPSFEEMTGIVTVPATARVLKSVQIVLDATYAGTGPCVRIDDVQAWAQVDGANWLDVQDGRARESAAGEMFIGAANSFANASAKLSFDGARVVLDRRDEDLSLSPPAISIQARTTGSIEYTLLLQSIPAGGRGYRKYMSATGRMLDVVNASYDNATNLWTKDVNGFTAFRQEARETGFSSYSRVSDTAWADASWIEHLTTSNPEVTTIANPKFAPLLMTRGPTGDRRVALDHLGLRAGRVTEMLQTWLPPMLASWTVGIAGTATATTIYSDANIPGPARQLFVNANADRVTNYGWQVLQGPLYSNQVHVLEFELSGPDLLGTPGLVFQAGFIHDETAEPSGEDYIKFYKSSANANWMFQTQGTTSQSTNTGVAAGAALNKFRIEAYGPGCPGGTRALGFIDGVLVAEHASNLPANDLAPIVVFLKATAVLTNKSVVISPVRYTSARYLADDAL